MKKTKWIALLLAMAMLLALSACGNSDAKTDDKPAEATKAPAGTTETPAESGSGAESLDGEMIEAPEAGIALPKPKTYSENEDKVMILVDGGKAERIDGLYYLDLFLYPATLEELNQMNDEEWAVADEQALLVLSVFRVENDMTEKELKAWLLGVGYDTTERLTELEKTDEGTLYACHDDRYSETLPEELKPIYEGIIAELGEARNHIVLSKPVAYGENMVGEKLSFTTTDLNGKEVTGEELFAGNKYTMVNCWTSWCGPCIGELPELEALSKDFAEKGCGLIGILLDGTDPAAVEEALDIIADAGVTYPSVIPWEGLTELLQIQAVPTTFFVDSEGNIVGEFIVGADPEGYVAALEKLLGE